jgi:ankyrin repeat protein
MAALLARFGAAPSRSSSRTLREPVDRFASACLILDRREAEALLQDHPEFLQSPRVARLAVERDRADVLALLLDLGMSPDLGDDDACGQRLLHVAAYGDAPAAAALLIERGAEIDFRERTWGATPLGFAVHRQRPRMIDLLSRFSKDLWNLAFTGNVERVREILTAEPALARLVHPDGETPLMRLPDDEGHALMIVDLLLAHGADPTLRNERGRTAAECAAARALDAIAERLRAAERDDR